MRNKRCVAKKKGNESGLGGDGDDIGDGLVSTSLEVVINDYPQEARWQVARHDKVFEIESQFEVSLTTRGSYVPPGRAEPEDGKSSLPFFVHFRALSFFLLPKLFYLFPSFALSISCYSSCTKTPPRPPLPPLFMSLSCARSSHCPDSIITLSPRSPLTTLSLLFSSQRQTAFHHNWWRQLLSLKSKSRNHSSNGGANA